MELTVNWIVFSAIAIAVGASIDTRKWIEHQINIFIFQYFSYFRREMTFSWHWRSLFFWLNEPIQRMQLHSDWIYVNANRKLSFNGIFFHFELCCERFPVSAVELKWPKWREFVQKRKVKNEKTTKTTMTTKKYIKQTHAQCLQCAYTRKYFT